MPSRVHASYSRPTLPGSYARAGLPKIALAANAAASTPPAASTVVGDSSSAAAGSSGGATATVLVRAGTAARPADTSHSGAPARGGSRDSCVGAALSPPLCVPDRAARRTAPRMERTDPRRRAAGLAPAAGACRRACACWLAFIAIDGGARSPAGWLGWRRAVPRAPPRAQLHHVRRTGW
jgi:hypothetical protein